MKKRRPLIRGVSFLSAVVIALAIWGGVNAYKLSVAERSIKASNERALTQLGTYLDDINLNLQKCTYCSGESMLSDVTSEIWRSSASAKESLSEITDGNVELSGVYKFLSQVGEYTLSLKERIAKGEKISSEETENLNRLLRYSAQLSKSVNYLIEQEENGLLDFEEIKTTLQKENNERTLLGTELNDANQSLNDYPTLIYDGPFSDHIMNKKSALVEKLEVATEAQAKEKAADFLKIKSDGLKLLSKTNNNLSTYTFYNRDCTVSVTQKGAIVKSMLKSQYVSEIKLSYDEAVKKAAEYLRERGYTKIKESYYSTTDGICTVNFSYYDNGVTYYTDLIKVSVALDTGEITGFDATGYIMNHKTRRIPSNPKYTPIEAKKLISENLDVISYKKAVIPTEWEDELYVYEYRCVDENKQEVLVYIDPVTGEEADILLLLYTDGGVLTK
ncbi:MAG: germination protein YpeB [Clostridia bacterium]|nr:germination protein YpeB [Clostridia bacterium]